MKTDHSLVIIRDWGKPEYLDGACMQYCVKLGAYPGGESVAYCSTLDYARLLANALTSTNSNAEVIISTEATS